jgi:hypothetical protein
LIPSGGVRSGRLAGLGRERLHPPVNVHVTDRDVALSEQLLNVAKERRSADTRAHRVGDHISGDR